MYKWGVGEGGISHFITLLCNSSKSFVGSIVYSKTIICQRVNLLNTNALFLKDPVCVMNYTVFIKSCTPGLDILASSITRLFWSLSRKRIKHLLSGSARLHSVPCFDTFISPDSKFSITESIKYYHKKKGVKSSEREKKESNSQKLCTAVLKILLLPCHFSLVIIGSVCP